MAQSDVDGNTRAVQDTPMGWIKDWFKKRQQRKNDRKFGQIRFLTNFAIAQLGPDEYIDMNPASPRTGEVRVTASGGRPVLTFKFWPRSATWSEELPVESLIIEESRISRKRANGEWEVVDENDEVVKEFSSFFLAFAFYYPMRGEHKKTLTKETPSAEEDKTLLE